MAHAQTQALRRCGVDLREEQYRELVDAVQRGQGVDLGPARAGGRLWRVTLADVELLAVFRDGLIRTFLDPARALELTDDDEAGAQES